MNFLGSTLRANIDKLHTTDLGIKRIRKNMIKEIEDVVDWCKKKIMNPNNIVARKGKYLYIHCDDCTITVHASTYTIITAHRS